MKQWLLRPKHLRLNQLHHAYRNLGVLWRYRRSKNKYLQHINSQDLLCIISRTTSGALAMKQRQWKLNYPENKWQCNLSMYRINYLISFIVVNLLQDCLVRELYLKFLWNGQFSKWVRVIMNLIICSFFSECFAVLFLWFQKNLNVFPLLLIWFLWLFILPIVSLFH